MSLTTIGTSDVVAVEPARSALEVAHLMRARSVRVVVVTDGARPIGILTHRDLAERGAQASGETARAYELMSRPLVAMREDADLREVETAMRERGLRRIPLVGSNGDLVGLITLDDLVRHYSRTPSSATG